MNPLASYHGVLPNGESFRWVLLQDQDVAAILALQDHVAGAANDLEKTFLIQRSAQCFHDSLAQGHVYWGAYVGDQLVGLFGLADNDEEVGDGRGHKTPKDLLGVDDYIQASILKGAQVHPAYRDQGLAQLGALSRYLYFTNNPDKRVLMTKVSAHNEPVCNNYLKNGFTEVFRTLVNDRGYIFDVVTFKIERASIETWLREKTKGLIAKYKLMEMS